MSKKILSVVLALVLVMSTFVTVAFAANYEADEDKAKYTQTWSLTNVQASDDGLTYTVDVNLKTNYATGVIQFAIVEEDTNNVIQLTGATVGAAVPAAYNANIIPRLSKGIVYIVPQAADVGDVDAVAIDGVVATLTFSYTGTGKAKVAISNDPKTAENPGGTLIAGRMGTGKIGDDDMIGGQTVTNTDALITPVELGKEEVVADPELVGKDGGTGTVGYVDEARGYVYGIDFGATDPTKYFEATNNGYIEMTANASGVVNGTGAILTLYRDNTKAEVIKEYTLIVFGDFDGNGAVQNSDAVAIAKHVSFQVVVSDAARLFAADVDCNDAVQNGDAVAIAKHVSFQATYEPNIRNA